MVLADVSHELLVEVNDGGEDPTPDDIAQASSGPVSDLIEPRRVGQSVVHANTMVLEHKHLYHWRLLAADVSATPVNLAAQGLTGNNVLMDAHERLDSRGTPLGTQISKRRSTLPGCARGN